MIAALVISPETEMIDFEIAHLDTESQVLEGAALITEMPGDQERVWQTRKSLLSLKAGELVMPETVETKTKPIRSLQDALLRAQDGDLEAREMVSSNVRTHAMETLFKAGNYSRVPLITDENGEIIQNGQSMDDIHKNAYRYASGHPVLAERTLAEANNGARIKWINKEGLLEDNYFVVLSLCDEDLSDEELDELLFFSKTKSLSVQVTSADQGALYTETAFVAGVADEGAMRHDREATEAMANRFGVDYASDSAAQIIDKPLLIPKELLPEGVIDLVKMFDQLNNTFFGQNVPRQDYDSFKEFCIQREANFADMTEDIVDRLVLEADILDGPARASKRLSKLVEERLVKKAIADETIEAWVFGSESAENIKRARLAIAEGKVFMADYFEQTAVDTARSGACTAGSCGLESVKPGSKEAETVKTRTGTKDTTNMLKDTERTCPDCKSKSIVYDLKTKTKICTNRKCGATKNY